MYVYNLREKSGPKIKYPGEFGDPGGFGDLDEYPALVLHYSVCGSAGAFLCISYSGKLIQHKLIRVQCTGKSTRVPVSPVPQYGYSVQKNVVLIG